MLTRTLNAIRGVIGAGALAAALLTVLGSIHGALTRELGAFCNRRYVDPQDVTHVVVKQTKVVPEG